MLEAGVALIGPWNEPGPYGGARGRGHQAVMCRPAPLDSKTSAPLRSNRAVRVQRRRKPSPTRCQLPQAMA
jgi:hypothetical protein